MIDLELAYADAAARLANSLNADGELESPLAGSIFERGSLPTPPRGLRTARISIACGSHLYGPLTVDVLHVSAHRETYRALGLWILAALLTPGAERFELSLTNPASMVESIIVDTMYRQNGGGGLRTEARGATYFPSKRTHLGKADTLSEGELPTILLTDREGFAGRDDPTDPPRDVVVGFGSDAGAYRIVELLFDISQSWNEGREYTLEGPFGFGGVAALSAEIRFWLPGGFGWDPTAWGDSRTKS